MICPGLVYATWVLVPEEARRWCGILWSCSCRQLRVPDVALGDIPVILCKDSKHNLTISPALRRGFLFIFVSNVTLSFIPQSFCYTFLLGCLCPLENLFPVTNAGEHNCWQWKILVTFMVYLCVFMFLEVGVQGLLHTRQEFYHWEHYSSVLTELKLWIRRYFNNKKKRDALL